ncbi:MAG: type II toxin-antitoxin system VapC family toxin [Parcubacteria group bacterium]|nr:type II toxin-antitoxin system VapC family toxin [Parcubacteria group bacterium]
MTIDANIIIAYLGGDANLVKTLTKWRQLGLPLFLSTVVETEILSFPGMAQAELQNTEKFLEENFISITFDRALARIAAEIRRGTKIKFPDAAIAATALFTRTPLVTRNIKDFKRIPTVQILAI